MNCILASTRFNSTTRDENIAYRREKQYDGCIYGSPVKISSKVPENHKMFVFEMDISPDVKDIIGIGFINNVLDRKVKCAIYDSPKYNKYIYYSKYRIDVKDMTVCEMEFIKKMQYALFKTKSHVQRSIGITQIPVKNILNVSFTNEYVVQRVVEMFTSRRYSDSDSPLFQS